MKVRMETNGRDFGGSSKRTYDTDEVALRKAKSSVSLDFAVCDLGS
jgi:hypothetical protein